MQAPDTVRLKYVGIPNVKERYCSGDPGFENRVVDLDATGERYPSEGDFSLEFASRVLREHGDEFEVVGDDDGSRREALMAWKPGIVAKASKNIQIIDPDGTVREFPPGSIINVHPPGTTLKYEAERSEDEPPTVGPDEAVPEISQQKLNAMSKPKVARWAKANLKLELDPDAMNKREMVDAVLEALGG